MKPIEVRRRIARDQAALVKEAESDLRRVPDAPPPAESEEDLPFGDPRTLTSEAQRRGR